MRWFSTGRRDNKIAAEKAAGQKNADCEQEIAVALLEYRRQRSAIARLTPDERAVVQAAGGLRALRTATVGMRQSAKAPTPQAITLPDGRRVRVPKP